MKLQHKKKNVLVPFERLRSVRYVLMFLKEVSYVHQSCIYLMKNTENIDIVKYYYNLNII